ncbi:hypothetical protein GYH30_041933 [Glycine max]|nr:hypothetical protein GYH30_041933 [Glycine max]
MRWKWGGEAVKDEDEGDVGEEGERDGVFKVMEVIGGDDEVRVKGLVVVKANEEFHGDGGY